jgi:HD-GYP domain-containing protein (c-di-GMP phosphodiesterase class II)
MGESFGGRAALERRTVQIANPQALEQGFTPAIDQSVEAFVFYCGVPLVVKGEVKGVLEVFHRSVFEGNPEWLEYMDTLAEQAAIAIDNGQLFENLERSNQELSLAYDATIEGWSRALDLRDRETEGHTLRVTDVTLRLARAAGASDAELVHVRRGALLHDIGKLGVPDAILLKPAALTAEETAIMRRHPLFAYEMLAPIAYLRPALDIPQYHHEMWNGQGYPYGLRGEQIPMMARLFAVVDVWDALLSDRPYRPGWPEQNVLDYIRSRSGSHFDPQAVALFFKVLKK